MEIPQPKTPPERPDQTSFPATKVRELTPTYSAPSAPLYERPLLLALPGAGLLALAIGFFVFAGPQSTEQASLSAEEMRSPALARGMEQVLARQGRAPASTHAPEEPAGIDYSGLPYEPPSPPPLDNDPAYGLGDANGDYLEENYRVTLEKLSEQEDRLREAQAAGDEALAAHLAGQVERTRRYAEELQHETEARKND